MTVVDKGIFLGGGATARTMYEDVGAFHEKFDLPRHGTVPPRLLDLEALTFRTMFHFEEMMELVQVHVAPGNRDWFAEQAENLADQLKKVLAQVKVKESPTVDELADAMDAMLDLTYVALGTAHMMGSPVEAGWREVVRANLSKERATGADDPRGKRGSALDVVKPEGWRPPNHRAAILGSLLHWETMSGSDAIRVDRPLTAFAAIREALPDWAYGKEASASFYTFEPPVRQSCLVRLWANDDWRFTDAATLTDENGNGATSLLAAVRRVIP